MKRDNERTRKREKVGKEEITNTDTCRMKKGNTTIDIHSDHCHNLNFHTYGDQILHGDLKYEDIFSNTNKQKQAVVLFTRLIEKRTKILKSTENPPGDILAY